MKSKEELLAEAKLRYPIGTKYKSAYDGTPDGIVNVTNPEFKVVLEDNSDDVKIIHFRNCLRWVYYRGNWAEIISKPSTITKQQKQNILKMIEEI